MSRAAACGKPTVNRITPKDIAEDGADDLRTGGHENGANALTHNAQKAARLSVAPMMDWTDRHCRYFHRLMSREVLLYTEMVTSPALVRGGALHLLDHDDTEHPVALQLGGSDPKELAAATTLCVERGYDEVNLNVGCPSDRVQSGTFGAVLMRNAPLVADCVSAMLDASQGVDITVKCRIGVDDQTPEEVLPDFLEKISATGVTRITIHARKAWLKGLSPKENRDIPPLDYPLVHRMKQQFPHLHLSINGGITTLEEAQDHLTRMDGVMIGRAAYHSPGEVLLTADRDIYHADVKPKSGHQVVEEMYPYIERQLAQGLRLNAITRHMLGLFSGRPGARMWRRSLSEEAHKSGAGIDVVQKALSYVPET
ncbi:tRNA-dihydrouridine(20/20a) synthase [Aliiroseovarius sp. xm-m-379]|nr:tRNA-dihydrouridine(20/20a) synthase [Aliiroseovarius sp. xm-d-517]NRP26315.1 tRNA-dihydrouridine(20/20a) synthase [Aliiroseovarius sp. xm-m-379]NRP35114.1 tRNA-dihydrouridine(20/20a) synthase [Aliiroseovarius sp. xm-a-104]NRQ09337.1 tRNA-dihydrouridine(20/20a) synthase [Aliiroseovarius sp. xm-v-201]NRQ22235.1 tRNA-dihydrouridine(20/20a) synthase [Aliiroseovarius sp. xm-v-204]